MLALQSISILIPLYFPLTVTLFPVFSLSNHTLLGLNFSFFFYFIFLFFCEGTWSDDACVNLRYRSLKVTWTWRKKVRWEIKKAFVRWFLKALYANLLICVFLQVPSLYSVKEVTFCCLCTSFSVKLTLFFEAPMSVLEE